MMRLVVCLSLAAALLCAAPGAFAGTTPIATLSSPQDLSHLTVGEQVTIDVNITSLAVGSDFIFNLDTSILFSSSLFKTIPNPGTASGLTTTYGSGSGSVFLYAGQPAAFDTTSSLNPGNAIGIFNNSSSAPAISENGVYYSFTLEALASGSGSISFDTTPGANQYAADDTGFNYAPLPNGGSLSFSITAVPEPPALSLGLVAVMAGAVLARRRCRKQAG